MECVRLVLTFNVCFKLEHGLKRAAQEDFILPAISRRFFLKFVMNKASRQSVDDYPLPRVILGVCVLLSPNCAQVKLGGEIVGVETSTCFRVSYLVKKSLIHKLQRILLMQS